MPHRCRFRALLGPLGMLTVVGAVTCWLLARYALLLYAGPWTVLVLVYCWPSVLAAAAAGVCMSGM